jgi:hypothetical protein
MSQTSERNSCLMTAKWDFATSNNTGKHTEGREIYRLNSVRWANSGNDEDNYEFITIETKNKVRGHGKCLVVRFESSPGKDFELQGWALDVTGVTQ